MKPSPVWHLQTGLSNGMSVAETLAATPGEVTDIANVRAIQNGARQKIRLSFEEAMKLR